MANRKIYNQVGVFSSNAPSSGYHFLSSEGIFINSDDPDISTNLVFPLNRIIHSDFGIAEPRIDIKGLGNVGNIARPQLSPATVNLNFSYYQMGLINEARLGFVFNHPSGETSNTPPIYNGNVIFVSGFLDRKFENGIENELGYPLTTREPRNIFIATQKDALDLNDSTESPIYKSNTVNVYAFGDCYLNSYNTSCSVGNFPLCQLSYSCNNVVFYDGGSGKITPSVDPKTFTQNTDKLFNIPNTFQGTGLPSVILPRNITIDISGINSPDIYDLPVNVSDLKIQGYDINLDLNRTPLLNLGYRLPMDYPIKLPIIVTLNVNSIVGDSQTGSLVDLVKKEKEYNIRIKLKYSPNTLFDGTAVMYDFIGAKFDSLTINDSIGQNRNCNLTFSTEINPSNVNKGFFVSGQLGIPNSGVYPELLIGDDFFGMGVMDTLITEEGSGILISLRRGRIIY